MNINQALKEKNRLVGKIAKLKIRLTQSVSWIKGNKPPYVFDDVLDELAEASIALVSLKTLISKATVPVIVKIIQMAELKSQVEIYKMFDVKSGIVNDRYGVVSATEYESAFTVSAKDSMVENLEDQIGKLQDELDKFNATTEI